MNITFGQLYICYVKKMFFVYTKRNISFWDLK